MPRETGLVHSLQQNEVFVFGSNEAGRHGKGAAKLACAFGAKRGVGVGFAGSTFAIPTKDARVRTLSLSRISKYVDEFVACAEAHPNLTFLVTEIGCGLAGYTPSEVAPHFGRAADLANVHLPASFWAVLRATT